MFFRDKDKIKNINNIRAAKKDWDRDKLRLTLFLASVIF